MATKVEFLVIKATSNAFNGPRYMAHVPNIGFTLIPAEGDQFMRQVMKFNPEALYDRNEIKTRSAFLEKRHPGYTISQEKLSAVVVVE